MADNTLVGVTLRPVCIDCAKPIAGSPRRGRCNPCRQRHAYHSDVEGSRRQAYKRAWYLKNKYGLDLAAYDAMLDRQGGVCAICAGDQPGTGKQRFHVDHDHKCCPGTNSCGECIRGLLCNSCNVGLALFKDNPRALLTAVEYLGGESDSR